MQYNENLTNFKEHLTQILKAKDISGVELAKVLGVTKQTISNYKVGKAAPDYETLQHIADFLDVSVDELLTGRKPENKPMHKLLGLSESAIENIKEINTNTNNAQLILSVLSDILSSNNLESTLEKVIDCYTETMKMYEHFTLALNNNDPAECRVIIKSIETIYKAKISRLLFNFFQNEIERSFQTTLKIKKFIFEHNANKK